MKNKIGWCNATWNPVWGCLNHCEYCYARKIAKRFWRQRYIDEMNHYFRLHPSWVWTGDHLSGLEDFQPTFLESQFDKKLPKKPQRIFVGSMSEIAHWEAEWVNKVIFKILEYPQHTFQFLTKHPEVYSKYDFPDNCWLGVTITKNLKYGENNRWDYYLFIQDNPNNLKFYCFEPLLTKIELMYYQTLKHIDWVIIGAETGNRKGKIIPERKWIEDIVFYCTKNKIPLYTKDKLKDIYPHQLKEFPKEGCL